MSDEPIVYVATQRSVYRHGLVGVYATMDAARSAALYAVRGEGDHFHDVEVRIVRLGELPTFEDTARPRLTEYRLTGFAQWRDLPAPAGAYWIGES